jgi:peptidoglycan hydrolase-like protein with peptidoglycan-binding domain
MSIDSLNLQIYDLEDEWQGEIPCTADMGVTEAELEIAQLGRRSLFVQMPESGPGFVCYGPVHKRYGRSEVVRALQHISKLWQQAYPNGPRLQVGNISLQEGGFMEPHTSHQKGVDVDIAPIANDTAEIPLTWSHPQYSRERSQQLVDLIHNNPLLKVRSILFNDPNVRDVSPWAGHDNHLHVSFFPSNVPEAEFSSDQEGSLRLTSPPMKGERVRKLQEGLVKAGIEVSVDAIFGDGTDAALRKFQAQHGLEVDGKAGPVTLAKLTEAKAQQVTITAPSADLLADLSADQSTAPAAMPNSSSASGMLLQVVIDQNRAIDFSDLNDSDLINEPDLCREVQIILQACGLLSTVDGTFGPRTQGAIRSFKANHQLLGGDILDATTAQSLLLARPTGGVLPNWQGGDKQAAIQAIIQESKRHGITAPSQIAYILATVEHESAASFQPVREAYFLGEPKAENHRKTLRYYPFYGRGYVQLTWDYNYRNYSTLLGLDLINQPDLVMQPDVALFILVDGMKRGVFTGVGLEHYINNTATDFNNARRIINGMDRASDIASLASNWFSNLA